MRAITVTIPANSARQVSIGASFIKYLAGSAGGLDPTVSVSSNRYSSPIPLLPGQGFRFEEAAVDWWMTNANAYAVTATMLFASGGFVDDRVTGTVDVVDAGRSRTLAGVAFSSLNGVAAAASQYPVVQLWNPSAARNLIVSQLTVGSLSAQQLQLGFLGSALPSLYSIQPTNKRAGGVVSVAQARTDVPAALPAYTHIMGFFVLASTSFQVPLREPIVLPPNVGLVAAGVTVNTSLVVACEFIEEPI